MKKTIIVFLALIMITVSSMVYAQSETAKSISISLINQDPDPSIAGDVVEVRLGIENRGGGGAKDLILEIMPEYPFSMAQGYDVVQKVGTMQPYQTGSDMQIVKFKIKVNRDATAGSYELKMKEYEADKKSGFIQRSVSIDVESKESAEVIYIDKTTLVPGKQSSLMFTINNVGSAPLRDLTFRWMNEDKVILPVGSDNTKYMKYIEMGDSAELHYQVIADSNADPGLYELSLYLSYDDPVSGEEKEISTIAGVYVGGETDFDVAFSESSGTETSFSVANIGSNPANSVSVIIPEQEGWRVSGSNSVIIGNLNKGDYTVASFSIQAINRNDIDVMVMYTDTMGERKSVEKTVAVGTQTNMTGARSARMTTTTSTANTDYYMWAIVLLLLALGYVIYKNKSAKKR